MNSAKIADVVETTAEIHKLLAGKTPDVQGAILARISSTCTLTACGRWFSLRPSG